jgi:glycosyltransferase involved in cell wall biosynthesis
MRISAFVITSNEESNIGACLEALAWVDEIIVVDAMSSDRTREIAARYTQHVFSRPWEGYAPAREYALSKCTSQWVLAVDADERVTPELRAEIERALEQPAYDGFLVPRKAFFLGRWIKHCGWYPGYVLRLFKKDLAWVTDRKVHEGMRVRGPVGTFASPLMHYTYPTVESYFARFDRYTTLAAEELRDGGARARPTDFAFRPLFMFVKMYLVKLGVLDGLEGLVLCAFSSLYVLVKYAKLREMNRGSAPKPRAEETEGR